MSTYSEGFFLDTATGSQRVMPTCHQMSSCVPKSTFFDNKTYSFSSVLETVCTYRYTHKHKWRNLRTGRFCEQWIDDEDFDGHINNDINYNVY